MDIPQREHGYRNFESLVLRSQKDLEAFLKGIKEQGGWNDRATFVKALTGAKVDFRHHALVLIRHTEGSEPGPGPSITGVE